uniref:NADH dehydrogenase [ubiquinone] iron-sulfur protein 5-like n=1 Tax=Halichoerus grypus TaxID=9711 RepID=UPI001659710C|nr:NADH dehydrogenase [ubiquinone] iron-sulfur protein 5-like [Halichoerus grypus]
MRHQFHNEGENPLDRTSISIRQLGLKIKGMKGHCYAWQKLLPKNIYGTSSKETRRHRSDARPFFDVQKRLGLNLDHWMTIQSAEQPHKIPGRCHAFEKEWIECAHGIGGTRAEKECKIKFDDFVECLLRQKTTKRLSDIRRQRDKLIKEGKNTPPPHHLGKEDPRP